MSSRRGYKRTGRWEVVCEWCSEGMARRNFYGIPMCEKCIRHEYVTAHKDAMAGKANSVQMLALKEHEGSCDICHRAGHLLGVRKGAYGIQFICQDCRMWFAHWDEEDPFIGYPIQGKPLIPVPNVQNWEDDDIFGSQSDDVEGWDPLHHP